MKKNAIEERFIYFVFIFVFELPECSQRPCFPRQSTTEGSVIYHQCL
jgi:hypothetical protein